MAIEFKVLANKGQDASAKGGKVVTTAKGAAPTVTLEYLLNGVRNGSKEPAFPRQLGDAILNGIAGKEGKPARMNGQDVKAEAVAAYLALPAEVQRAIKFEAAVEAVASMSALIVSGYVHNTLLELAETAEAAETEEHEELAEETEAAETEEHEELTADDFLK